MGTYQLMLDRWTPYTTSRWVATVLLICAFMARILIAQGWYIVTYALAIYHLNLLLAFLTPKIDPAMAELDAEEDGPDTLPTSQNEESDHLSEDYQSLNSGIQQLKLQQSLSSVPSGSFSISLSSGQFWLCTSLHCSASP